MSAAAVVTEEAQDAVVEAPAVAVPTVAPPTQAVFQSRREELVLVMEKDPYTVGANGEKNWGVGKHVKFVDGHLRVPLKRGAKTRGTRGEVIDAGELLLFLEGGKDASGEEVMPHILFNNREEGFWRHREAAPAISEAESDELLVFAEERDLKGIEAFIAREEAGWARPELLKVAEGSRDRVKARLEDEGSS